MKRIFSFLVLVIFVLSSYDKTIEDECFDPVNSQLKVG